MIWIFNVTQFVNCVGEKEKKNGFIISYQNKVFIVLENMISVSLKNEGVFKLSLLSSFRGIAHPLAIE